MAYINVDPAYFTHRKTLRLVARLGAGADVVPIRLWAYCALHHPKDGALLDYCKDELEALLSWPSSNASVVDALVDVGFLDACGDAWVCHDWLEHQGHIRKFKERAEKAAFERWGTRRKRKRKAARQPDATSNAKPPVKQSSSNAPAVPTNQQYMALPTDLEPHRQTVETWLTYKREKGQSYKPTGLKTLYKAMIKLGSGLPAAVEHSMQNNYAGLFAPGGNNGRPIQDRSFTTRASQGDKFAELEGRA